MNYKWALAEAKRKLELHKTIEKVEPSVIEYDELVVKALEKAEKYDHFKFVVNEALVSVSKCESSAEYGLQIISEALKSIDKW